MGKAGTDVTNVSRLNDPSSDETGKTRLSGELRRFGNLKFIISWSLPAGYYLVKFREFLPGTSDKSK
jgi:hypothetical protein